MKTRILLFWGIIHLMAASAFGQSTPDSSMFKPNNGGSEPKKYVKGLSNISVSGYYRFLACYSTMAEQYPEMGQVNNRLFMGDDSNLPQLSLTLGINPTKNTSISTDLYLWTPLTGSDKDYVKGLLLGMNLYGSHTTEYGTFGVRTGGIHWVRLSPLTFASNTGYNRYSIFERNPWDPNTKKVFERYENFYKNGALTQDVRWGQQAFQGIIMDGADLPKDFSFTMMHGKSQLNGGITRTPNTLTGGRLQKNFGKQFVSVNALYNKTYTDSLSTNSIGFNLYTTEFEFDVFKDKLILYGEVGAGNYFSPNATGNWGEAMDFRLKFSERLTHFPIELRYFRVSPNVLNNNGIFWNTSIYEYQAETEAAVVDGGQAPLLFPFSSSLTNIGQITNNRQGIILNTDLKFGRNKVTIGYSSASELSAKSDKITYGHPANNLALSRFWRWGFPANVGPYGNISKVYRSVYETLYITDSVSAKGFNSVELSYKTHFKLFNRELMVFYLGGFHSIQRNSSVLPQFSKKSYLQSYNNQLEFYYALTSQLTICNYFGFDRIYGGENTERDVVSNYMKDQLGTSYAIGLDIQLARNTGLYVRHRWMQYQDFSYSLDKYKGMETTVELKIFF